ncbi:MAG: BaiN/RdsA family NAD(P)/FAD-dependent oxidoreductase [Dehalococcoidia bacterium]
MAVNASPISPTIGGRGPRNRGPSVQACDIAVIGAGAAGLAAAIFAAEAAERAGYSLHIAGLDSAPRIGRKILISGGGRCNVTHDAVSAQDFNGDQRFVRNVLAAFGAEPAQRWFATLGVALKREATGKLFPVSDRAQSVLDALIERCRALGVDIRSGSRVLDVRRPAATGSDCSGFEVRLQGGSLFARRIVMATGGRSLPATGSDGSGWAIVRRLGHSVTTTFPALVPLVLAPSMFHAALSGLSIDVELSVFSGGRRTARHSGSLLWTHFGVSGPVMLDASRHWTVAQHGEAVAELRCSFLAGKSYEQVERWLIEEATLRPRRQVATTLSNELPERLGRELVTWAGIDPVLPIAQLSRIARRQLCHALTAFVLPVVGARGWNYAEVTAGGVPLDEVDCRTLESRLIPHLYLVGEMLDCDGRIGGFNFQWAWSTGYLAGGAAARSLATPATRQAAE